MSRRAHKKTKSSRTNEQKIPPSRNNIRIVAMNVCVDDHTNSANQKNESNNDMIVTATIMMEVVAASAVVAAAAGNAIIDEGKSTSNDKKFQPASPFEKSEQQTRGPDISKEENKQSKTRKEDEQCHMSVDDDGKATASNSVIDEAEKHVTFYPYVMTRFVPNKLTYTDQHKEELWYTDKEYETMIQIKRKLQNRLHRCQRQEIRKKIQQQINHHSPADVDNNGNIQDSVALRVKHFICCGLTTMKQEMKRQEYKQKAIQAVLSEEFTQWTENGDCNPQRLATVYSKYTHVAQQEAYHRAQQVVMQLSSALMA